MKPTTTAIHQLMFTRDGGSVKRMHTVRTIHAQTVAEHSFGVAWLVWALADGKPSANLLMAALAHDVPEVEVGDLPSPTKRALNSGALQILEDKAMENNFLPLFNELTQQEQTILRLADMFELAFFCVDEHNLGNRTPRLHEMFNKVMSYIDPLLVSHNANELAEGIYHWLLKNWRRANEC